jgi:hypothetical protein
VQLPPKWFLSRGKEHAASVKSWHPGETQPRAVPTATKMDNQSAPRGPTASAVALPGEQSARPSAEFRPTGDRTSGSSSSSSLSSGPRCCRRRLMAAAAPSGPPATCSKKPQAARSRTHRCSASSYLISLPTRVDVCSARAATLLLGAVKREIHRGRRPDSGTTQCLARWHAVKRRTMSRLWHLSESGHQQRTLRPTFERRTLKNDRRHPDSGTS